MDQTTATRAEAPDLRQLLRPVWIRRWWILATVVTATVATYVYYNKQPRQYRSSTSIFVQQAELETALFGASYGGGDDRTLANQASLLQTDAVVRVVAQRPEFRGQDPGSLRAGLSVTPRTGQDFIDISVVDGNPVRAAELANAFAQAFIESRATDLRTRVTRSRTAAQRELDATPKTPQNLDTRNTLEDRIRQLQVVESLPSGSAQQLDQAGPGGQIAPNPRRNARFAALLSLVLAVGAAFGLNRFDRRLRTLDSLEGAFGLPLLGTLPLVGEAAPLEAGVPAIAPLFREACRSLRTNVELSALDRPVKTLLVTSGLSGEGKSTLVRSLALVYAEAGLRVAVVEADVRRPSVSRSLSVEQPQGLTEVIAGQVRVDEVLRDASYAGGHSALARHGVAEDDEAADGRGFAEGHLEVLASGAEPSNPPVMLGSTRMKQLLIDLSTRHDIVIIDSPPLLVVSDAVPLMGVADATIVVARVGETLRDAAKRVGEVIARVPDANALGIVANGVNSGDVAGGFRYYSYTADTRRPWWRPGRRRN